MNKKQRPISANPKLLKSSRRSNNNNDTSYREKANLIQTAYGSKITIQQHQSSSVKSNRPKSAPMHRLPFANLQLQQQQHNEQTKKILQPSPTKKSARRKIVYVQ